MSRTFDFVIRRADLSRVNALRLDMGSDFWPEAAFAIFASAADAEALGATVEIPAAIRERAVLTAKSRGYAKVIPAGVRVRQFAPDARTVAFIERLAARYRMRPHHMATALVIAWAADPACWPGAPRPAAALSDLALAA